jgi:hypothetical protein
MNYEKLRTAFLQGEEQEVANLFREMMRGVSVVPSTVVNDLQGRYHRCHRLPTMTAMNETIKADRRYEMGIIIMRWGQTN